MQATTLSKKIISVILSGVLVLTLTPSLSYAIDNDIQQDTQVQVDGNSNDRATQANESETVSEDNSESTEVAVQLGTNTRSVQKLTNDASAETQVAPRKLNGTSVFEFIYIDKKEVELNATQSIVVSFLNKDDALTATLYYQKADGGVHIATPKQIEDGAALFELIFTSEDQIGTYKLIKATWGDSNPDEAPISVDENIGYSFSVIAKASDGDPMMVYTVDNNDQSGEDDNNTEAIEEDYGLKKFGLTYDSKGLRYLNKDGTYFNDGWKTVSGKTYYFGDDGYALRWEQDIEGQRYYFNGSYKMVTGWVTWYNDKSRSYFGGDGAAESGWHNDGSDRYYISPSTFHTVRWSQVIDGKEYYFDSDYKMFIGLLTWQDDGSKSFFGSDGVMISGWQKWKGKTYYIDPATMRAVRYGNTIDGQYYYFDSDCSLFNRGWLKWQKDGTYSYFDADGIMYKGKHTIDGIVYNFGTNGKCETYDWLKADMAHRAQSYSSRTNRLILVDRGNHKVSLYTGSKNNWHLSYYWSCVTGAPNTPTITGSYYTTGFKRNSLTTDSRAIWCTQIWGGYFFHSILVSESELGKSLSHGCIRLPYGAAQWIHQNIYAGTRVVIYN
mgnify:CR=1 FL=1